MRIRGTGGTISAGPRRTARVQAWQVVREGDDAYTVTFEPSQVDAYLWTVGPQTVALAMGARTWSWTIPALPEECGTDITVRVVGPPETN